MVARLIVKALRWYCYRCADRIEPRCEVYPGTIGAEYMRLAMRLRALADSIHVVR